MNNISKMLANVVNNKHNSNNKYHNWCYYPSESKKATNASSRKSWQIKQEVEDEAESRKSSKKEKPKVNFTWQLYEPC